MSRRRRSRPRNSRSRQKTAWGPLLIGLLVGVPLAAEVLARVLVATQRLELTTPGTEVPTMDIAEAYQLKFVTAEGNPYATPTPPGELKARRHPLLGYDLVANQQGQFWTINDQGFRESATVPLVKAEGEIRIVILGGSEAFGQLSSSNKALFSTQLQERLNQRVTEQRNNPGRFQPEILPYRADQVTEALALPPQIRLGQYRVINAAVPGYTSGNVLARLLYQVAAYDPDILVVMEGYGDLLLPSQQPAADIPQLDALLAAPVPAVADDSALKPMQWGQRLGDVALDHLYVVKVLHSFNAPLPEETAPEPVKLVNLMTDDPEVPLVNQVPEGPELQKRVDRYQQHMLQLVRWISATQKQLILVVPPEITGRSPDQITDSEAAIVADLGQPYQTKISPAFDQLTTAAEAVAARSANAKVFNFYSLNAPAKSPLAEQPLFQTSVSLTDAGQTVLADRLYGSIVADLALQPRPFGSR